MSDQIIEFIRKKDYFLEKEIGQGAFGRTVLIRDDIIRESFICKKYSPNVPEKKKYFENFIEEIKLLHLLYHRNIVRVFNYYLYPKQTTGFIIMEYIQGYTINEYIRIHPESINDIFKQTIEGFKYLESNQILHRDIRAQNIMVNRNGTVKIIDFGFGKQVFHSKDYNKSISLNWWCDVPDEFKEDKYNFSSEVYFIGKLFEQLINENQIENFVYKTLLHEMIHKDPNERKSSFSEISEFLISEDFLKINFSDSEKENYQEFANHLSSLISQIEKSAVYKSDIDSMIQELEKLYQNSSLEECIINVSALIRCFIDGATYYRENVYIPVDSLKEFIKLIKSNPREKQNIIINNLWNRLNSIKKYDKFAIEDLPF